MSSLKIILPGGAGLVGQNLVPRLKAQGYENIVIIDKNAHNLRILQKMHPETTCICSDLSKPGEWNNFFSDAHIVIMLQAQIGGFNEKDFIKNNEVATKNILQTCKQHRGLRLIHISSSVVASTADDLYTKTKRKQEKMVLDSGIICPILRPTLMFGWFDRKHLGWLSRFMRKVPIFPVPGNGRFVRQPLYVVDFCNIIIACVKDIKFNGIYNISGQQRIFYIDLVNHIKRHSGSSSLILKIPYYLFYSLLLIWALFDKNPPFTIKQLSALVAGDEFEVIDWETLFGIEATPLESALVETFNHSDFSAIELEF